MLYQWSSCSSLRLPKNRSCSRFSSSCMAHGLISPPDDSKFCRVIGISQIVHFDSQFHLRIDAHISGLSRSGSSDAPWRLQYRALTLDCRLTVGNLLFMPAKLLGFADGFKLFVFASLQTSSLSAFRSDHLSPSHPLPTQHAVADQPPPSLGQKGRRLFLLTLLSLLRIQPRIYQSVWT
jgi:hypothetical protein